MLTKKLTSVLAGVTIASGGALGLAPVASAQGATVDAERTVTFACQGDDADTVTTSTSPFTVSFPEEVAPGEIFTITVQPGVMHNGERAMDRVTFDYALPDNAAIIGLNLAGGSQGLSGTTASVVRVNKDNRQTNPDGSVARIWGGNSARYGSNSSTTGTGGLTVNANTDFRLPALEVVMRAPAAVGEDITVGLPGATLDDFTAASTDFQWVKRRTNSSWSTTNAKPNECSSDAGAEVLTTTTVGDLDPVLLDTTTTVSSAIDLLGPNQSTTLTAQVSTEFGALAQIADGEVTFRDAQTAEVLGTDAPDAHGQASIEHTFTPIAPGQPDQRRQIVAEFSGVEGDLGASTSSPVTVTLTGKPTVTYNTALNLRAVLGEESEASVPVTITANINRPSGTTAPDGLHVQLYRGDTPIGEPVPLPSDDTLSWTDSIERTPQTRAHAYRIESVPVIDDYEQWTATSPAPVTVTITGTNPSLDPPIVPGAGSLGSLSGSLGSFGSLTGSLGSLGS